MARSMTAAAKAALLAHHTGEAAILLLTIDHPDLGGTPVRLARANADVTSNGNLFTAFPFSITFPVEEDGQLASVKLTIDNVERTLIQTLGSISGAPSVQLDFVLSSDPDTVEAGPLEFTWRNTQITPTVIEADLQFEDLLNQKFPADSFTPGNFPALFS